MDASMSPHHFLFGLEISRLLLGQLRKKVREGCEPRPQEGAVQGLRTRLRDPDTIPDGSIIASAITWTSGFG
jgi:hypothetical protein